jgi:choline dehydrogenase-like flavoprotein
MISPNQPADVLIVGSGIMGAGAAARLRQAHPELRIVMVDGGSAIGAVAGQHLHDSTEPEIWERYNGRVASGIQGLYVGATTNSVEPVAALGELEPGMHHLSSLGEDAAAMPAAAAAWNVGGMGIHWTAATPWPWGEERFDDDRFDDDLAEAQRLLKVIPAALGPTKPGRIVLDVLTERYAAAPADRRPQPMPMAVRPSGSTLLRTGPSEIFPPIAVGGDENFTLLSGTLAVALLHDGARVSGARVRDVPSGEERDLEAAVTIVCADANRTPQLLFASGIRPRALGRFLNEHAFLSGRVLMDLDRFGLSLDELPRLLEGEFATDSLWLPQTGDEQPFHGQVMNTTFVDDEDAALAYSVGISLYTPIESRAENRLVFDETETDVMGMPRMRIEFAYSDRDQALIQRSHAALAEIAADFGDFDPATEAAMLPPGSSLHQTGTVRSGPVDDGTSVCDPDGRVWGFDNLYLAGNGVVPTPLACNSTLTGMITTVRATRAISRTLERIPR